MKEVKNLIIGFGKAGKTLAGFLASRNESTVLVEKDSHMYGGTCINVGCIPSKSLETSARLSAQISGSFEEKAKRYEEAVSRKNKLTSALRQKNYDKAASSGAEILDGTASFLDPHTIEVVHPDGKKETIHAERIFINTGSRPVLPRISGIETSRHVYFSETLMDLPVLPKELIIIGGGYIGLEFASYYANFGSHVTILQNTDAFIPREDREIADAVYKQMTGRGITVIRNAETKSIQDTENGANILFSIDGKDNVRHADAILAAAGRRPNTDTLNLEAAGVETDTRGAVKVDKHLRTSQSHIYAMGDVKGGLQFTYISLDDFRIIRSDLVGKEERTTENRGAVPYCVFLDPPMARVGLSEEEARSQGYDILVGTLPAAMIPKAKVLNKADGLLKVIVDKKTEKILGAHLFCAESHELINEIKMAMDAGLSYTVLRDAIYTHPTMSEAFNDLFAGLHA